MACNCEENKTKLGENVITIILKEKDEPPITWWGNEWNDYEYDGKCFIIKKGKVWLGIYNMDCVKSIKITYK